jgi:hypothetical protein
MDQHFREDASSLLCIEIKYEVVQENVVLDVEENVVLEVN